MKRMKRGFTIVELLMVVGIIAVLLGIVTTAASSSVKMSRRRKAQALCTMVEAGLATYYAQKDEWPITDLPDDKGVEASLTGEQVRNCVRTLVQETKDGNPMLDISGLFVSRQTGEPTKSVSCGQCNHDRWYAPKGHWGMDFMSAIHGTRKSQKKMKLNEMYFGYPHPDSGGFMRFVMTYNVAADQIHVGTWHWDHQ